MFRDRSNDAAFQEFLEGAQLRLFRHAYLLTRDHSAAQDLVQAALVKVFVNWRRIDHPMAYAQRIMVRSYLDGRDRDQRRQHLERVVAATDLVGAGPGGDRTTVLDALAQLPPRMRAVIVLRYWEDLSVSDTAVILGCHEGTVKSTSSKALAKLRALLGDAYDESLATRAPTKKE
jgi:RNA polymerase sigma-70 factor (sigma-E family)